MNTRRFSDRGILGFTLGVSLIIAVNISLLSSAGCAFNRAQSVDEPLLRDEKLNRLESTSQRMQSLQDQLAELERKSEAQSQELRGELESARSELAQAENQAESLENDLETTRDRLSEARERLSEERDIHRTEVGELNDRIVALESTVQNLLSQISAIRARHQVETTRLKKEIERLSAED